MQGEGTGRRLRGTIAIAAFITCLALAPSALAGVATYDGTGPLHVPDDTGPGGVTSTITVPPGRTAIQSVEVPNFRIDWAASAQELGTQFIGPDGTSLFLFTQGCLSYDEQDVWIFSDSGTQTAPNSKNDPKCNLPGGTFKPTDVFPTFKTLSIFSGKDPTGTWTLRAVDNGAAFTNQGTIVSWAVRVVHAPPVLTASGPGTVRLGQDLSVTASANANGALTVGGGAAPSTTALAANQPTRMPFALSAATLDQLRKAGSATFNVGLSFTDETGGTANSNVGVTVLSGKKKCKKGRKLRKGKCVKKKKRKR